jgi:hypothetical protein
MKRREILSNFGMVMIVAIPTICAAQGGTKEEKVKSSQLPAAVAQAIRSECPGCTIAKATREKENGVSIYDFEFKPGQGEMDVAADGSIIDRETVVQTSDVPAPALDAIRKAGGTIKQIARDEVRAELKDGRIIKLDTPKYLYEADLVKGNKVGEVVVTPEGQVTEGPKWRAKGAKEN